MGSLSGLEAADTEAVLLFIATLFTTILFMVIVFMMKSKCCTVPHTEARLRALDHEKAGPGRANVDVLAIFLSHSGRQKPFVEHLYDALQNANHTPFFDRHSLPKGSPFPPHIKQAARGCKLGVVVLSDDFLTSKWPMLELEMLVLERGLDAMVLPLFYKLRPEDLKSSKNLSRWRSVWKEKASEHADQWEKAVQTLSSLNGEVFVETTSEVAYIKKVVERICSLVPCHVPYDLSSIQGHQRLAEKIARIFEHVKARHREESACMVGLHGVGGLGKTTLCKSMVNFYTSQYHGRSCLIEFPLDGDKAKMVQECKRALKKVTNLSNERLLNEAHSFDQVVHLMREHVKGHDVFLAIDNVSKSSREEAERLLGVGFSSASKILLTSRSEQALQELLIAHTDTSYIGPLPAPMHEEAFQIFQKTFKLGNLSSLQVDSNQIDKVLEKCRFNGIYHALALKALAEHVTSACALGDLKNIKHHLSLILKETSNALDLQTLEEVIRLNYENLPQHIKHMFLDIVVLFMQVDVITSIKLTTYAKALQWLCFLYKEFPESKITRLIYELALDGLIQIKVDDDGKKIIGVHDLYSYLAQRESANNSRFFTKGSSKSLEEMEWERLERVILRGEDKSAAEMDREILNGGEKSAEKIESEILRAEEMEWESFRGDRDSYMFKKQQHQEYQKLSFLHAADINITSRMRSDEVLRLFEKLQQQECRKLQVLLATDINIRRIHLDLMPSLCVLILQKVTFTSKDKSCAASRVLNLSGLVQLQLLWVEICDFVERITGLDALQNLQTLCIKECLCLKNLDGLNGLIRLEALHIINSCEIPKKMPDLSGLTCLETLQLSHNASMEEIGNLSFALKDVRVDFCGALKKTPDVSGLTHLERLELSHNASMEEVGCLSTALKHVRVEYCDSLKKMPDLSGLTCLESLELSYNGSMEEVGCLSSALKDVRVEYCGALKKMPDLCGLTCLESLQLSQNASMEEVGSLSSVLKYVLVHGCRALKIMPDLSHLTRIERLELRGNEAMEEVGGEYLSSTLQHLNIYGCKRLRSFPSLNQCVHLQTLRACHHCITNGSVLGKLANLQVLGLQDGDWSSNLLNDQWKHLTSLRCLNILSCGSIEKLEVGCLNSSLESLEVWGCEAVEEIGDLSAIHFLQELRIMDCPRLKKVSGLVGISTRLKRLCLYGCRSLEESTVLPDVSLLSNMEDAFIRCCGRVKDWPPNK